MYNSSILSVMLYSAWCLYVAMLLYMRIMCVMCTMCIIVACLCVITYRYDAAVTVMKVYIRCIIAIIG